MYRSIPSQYFKASKVTFTTARSPILTAFVTSRTLIPLRHIAYFKYTSSILEVSQVRVLRPRKYTSSLLRCPPLTSFQVYSPAPSKYASSILQVYLGQAGEYTRAVLGEVRDKYIYFSKYTSRIFLQLLIQYTCLSMTQVSS